MQNWLVVGATSGIAAQLVRLLASRGHRLYLTGRDTKRLERLADDSRQRYNTEVQTGTFEALEFDKHEAFLEGIEESFGQIYGIVWAVGVMGRQDRLQKDFKAANAEHEINYTSALSLLGLAAERMEQRRSGHIVALGSVSGDRGRASNYIYGASKAALHYYMQGLRQRLAPSGVKVLTVKPGPVRTRMTDDLTDLPLLADPKDVARDIMRAIERGTEVLYTPWMWRFIMIAMRHIPECVFKKFSM